MSIHEAKEKRRELDLLLAKFSTGEAQAEERLRLAVVAGELRDAGTINIVLSLIEDPDEQVRWYAVNSLLKIDRSSSVHIFWDIFEKDPDEDVRSMAIACIGNSMIGSLDKSTFMRLKAALSRERSPLLKGSVYDSMLMVAAVQPSEWSLSKVSWRDLDKFEVDWAKVEELEKKILEENQE